MITSKKVLSGRRRGTVIVYLALSLVVLLGSAGLSIDVGNFYLQRDKAQRAADAAALAGAVQLENNQDLATADAAADQIAADNGYDKNAGATVTTQLNPDGVHKTWYKVYVAKPAPVFFMAVFGFRDRTVGAPATATFVADGNFNIAPDQYYGTAKGPYTISQFGPWAQYNYGDNYDPKYLENGSPNLNYHVTGTTLDPTGQGGYNYKITIPADYASKNGTSQVSLDLYDPYSSGSNGSLDEYRAPTGHDPDSPSHYWDTTLFRLYPPAGSPNADQPIATATCGENATTGSDNCGASGSLPDTWVTPDNFQFDASSYLATGGADFRLNVETIDGSSENGYELRAGPPLTGKQKFNPDNGAGVTATGHIEINFDKSGTSEIHMGYVPPGATSVTISKFDTDVGARKVTYADSNGNTWKGVLKTGNGEYYSDPPIELGSNYPGGNWSAFYTAGAQDTSVWNMTYTGAPGQGYVRLVQ